MGKADSGRGGSAEVEKAAAFRLLGLLDMYADHMQVLAEAWPGTDLLGTIGRHLEAMRVEAVATPSLAAAWLDLQHSHAEVLESFARCTRLAPEHYDELESHIGRVLDLQEKCLQIATTPRTT